MTEKFKSNSKWFVQLISKVRDSFTLSNFILDTGLKKVEQHRNCASYVWYNEY
jgi:hypothetical protein